MSQKNAPAILRLMQFASTAELAAYNTKKSPNGELALVTDGASSYLYVLNLDSAVTAGAPLVQPLVGPGQWVPMLGSGDTRLLATRGTLVVATGTPSTGALVQNTWTALPSAASQYAATGGGAFEIATATGIMTYAGPTRQYQVISQVVAVPGSGTDVQWESSISRTGNVIIGGTTNPNAQGASQAATATQEATQTTVDLIQFADGDAIQACVRNVTGTQALTILRHTLLLTPTF